MNLSFDDKESFMEAAGSLRFNIPLSDLNNTHQRMGGSDSMPAEGSEENEDIS